MHSPSLIILSLRAVDFSRAVKVADRDAPAVYKYGISKLQLRAYQAVLLARCRCWRTLTSRVRGSAGF